MKADRPLTAPALAGPGIAVGANTVGVPTLYRSDPRATLTIGRYGTIESGVTIHLGAPAEAGLTAYPFARLATFPEIPAPADPPLHTQIGSDVTLGAGATILPGARIGDGAVISPGQLVSGEVPAYAGRGLDAPARETLQRLRWWDWDENRVRLAIPHLLGIDPAPLLDFAAHSQTPRDVAAASGRRIYDCIMYNGEADILAIRLHELDGLVHRFVIVESDVTFSGLSREQRFDPADPRFEPFLPRIRHLMIRDMPATQDPWERERFQRNAVMRGLDDAAPSDLVILADTDEIPRAWSVALMAADRSLTTYGLALRLSYFYFNYAIVQGPEAAEVSAVATPRIVLDTYSPQELRMGIRRGEIGATVLQRAGWHLSYMFDRAGIQKKIREFSHQEFNTPEFLDGIDLDRFVRDRVDLFGQGRNVWDLLGDEDLPTAVHADRPRYARYLYSPPDLTPARLHATRPQPSPVRLEA